MTPVLLTQLNNGTPTAGSDCATMSEIMGLGFGSGQLYVPTVREVRVAAGNLGNSPAQLRGDVSKGLTTSQVRTALKTLTAKAQERGIQIEYVPPRSDNNWTGKNGLLREWLQAGYYVHTVVNYRLLNKLVPEISGQPSLVVDHSVGVFGWKSGTTKLYDPLYDTRYSGGRRVPGSPQDISWSVLDRLTGRFVSAEGSFWGYAVKPPVRPTLRRGSTGPDVTYAQQRLRLHGRTGVRVNGTFGWRTERGTRNFQRIKGLAVDGVIGPATWRELEEAP